MWQVRVVEGQPVQVGDRELTPVARVSTRVRRRALVGTERLAGDGQAMVSIRPIAIMQRTDARMRRLPVRDACGLALSLLAVVVLAAPLVALLAVYLGRGRRKRESDDD